MDAGAKILDLVYCYHCDKYTKVKECISGGAMCIYTGKTKHQARCYECKRPTYNIYRCIDSYLCYDCAVKGVW